MKTILEFTEEDIKRIIAAKYSEEPDKVTVSVKPLYYDRPNGGVESYEVTARLQYREVD